MNQGRNERHENRVSGMQTNVKYACIMKGPGIHHLDNEGVEQYQLSESRNAVAQMPNGRRLHLIRFIE